jgi:hypothetical protein
LFHPGNLTSQFYDRNNICNQHTIYRLGILALLGEYGTNLSYAGVYFLHECTV